MDDHQAYHSDNSTQAQLTNSVPTSTYRTVEPLPVAPYGSGDGHEITPPHKPSGTRRIALVVAIAVIVFGLIGAGVYAIMLTKNTTPAITDTTSPTETKATEQNASDEFDKSSQVQSGHTADPEVDASFKGSYAEPDEASDDGTSSVTIE